MNALFHMDMDMMNIASMHLEYENIRPYLDGNDRTGRPIINYFLMSANQIPIAIPFESRKQYLAMMENNDIDELTKVFVVTEKKIEKEVYDFLEMDKEQKRQLNRRK